MGMRSCKAWIKLLKSQVQRQLRMTPRILSCMKISVRQPACRNIRFLHDRGGGKSSPKGIDPSVRCFATCRPGRLRLDGRLRMGSRQTQKAHRDPVAVGSRVELDPRNSRVVRRREGQNGGL